MNIGIIIGIILICLSIVTCWGVIFTKIKFFNKLPANTIFFCVIAIICGIFVTIFAWAYVPYNPNSVKDKDLIQCQVCNKEYKQGSENAKSIRKTNMCIQCYQNYKNASDYLKELPVN